MFYYINQPCTPFFPVGLVKAESDFTVRLVKICLTLIRLGFLRVVFPGRGGFQEELNITLYNC